MSTPWVDGNQMDVRVRVEWEADPGCWTVTSDVDGSPYFDGSGPSIEVALIEALKAATREYKATEQAHRQCVEERRDARLAQPAAEMPFDEAAMVIARYASYGLAAEIDYDRAAAAILSDPEYADELIRSAVQNTPPGHGNTGRVADAERVLRSYSWPMAEPGRKPKP